jgi:hypothetical protein
LIGIHSLEHLNLTLKAAGFLKHNTRSKSHTFCEKLFLAAIARNSPLLTVPIQVQRMGRKDTGGFSLEHLGKHNLGDQKNSQTTNA